MSRRPPSEEQAKILFAEQINEQARLVRLHGIDPDTERQMAEFETEFDAESDRIDAEPNRDADRRAGLNR